MPDFLRFLISREAEHPPKENQFYSRAYDLFWKKDQTVKGALLEAIEEQNKKNTKKDNLLTIENLAERTEGLFEIKERTVEYLTKDHRLQFRDVPELIQVIKKKQTQETSNRHEIKYNEFMSSSTALLTETALRLNLSYIEYAEYLQNVQKVQTPSTFQIPNLPPSQYLDIDVNYKLKEGLDPVYIGVFRLQDNQYIDDKGNVKSKTPEEIAHINKEKAHINKALSRLLTGTETGLANVLNKILDNSIIDPVDTEPASINKSKTLLAVNKTGFGSLVTTAAVLHKRPTKESRAASKPTNCECDCSKQADMQQTKAPSAVKPPLSKNATSKKSDIVTADDIGIDVDTSAGKQKTGFLTKFGNAVKTQIEGKAKKTLEPFINLDTLKVTDHGKNIVRAVGKGLGLIESEEELEARKQEVEKVSTNVKIPSSKQDNIAMPSGKKSQVKVAPPATNPPVNQTSKQPAVKAKPENRVGGAIHTRITRAQIKSKLTSASVVVKRPALNERCARLLYGPNISILKPRSIHTAPSTKYVIMGSKWLTFSTKKDKYKQIVKLKFTNKANKQDKSFVVELTKHKQTKRITLYTNNKGFLVTKDGYCLFVW